jgi:sterol desaturase/sphingolipid hydroxylase (fatty acid hydroxylase superfamily)
MFWLAPHPPVARPQRGSPTLFTVPWIERHLSRVRPWQVVAVWAPVATWLWWRGAGQLGFTAAALWAVAGVLAWTLLEYVLHRWLFHYPFDHRSPLQHDVGFLLHGIHHDYPHDADRLVMPPLLTAAIAVVLAVPLRLLLGESLFYGLFSGLLVGYLWYDLSHYAAHHHRPRSRWARHLARHHLQHHFTNSNNRFGVSTPFWDWVFRTLD